MKTDKPAHGNAQLQLQLLQPAVSEVMQNLAPGAARDCTLRDEDADARAQALDCTQSFIVRAPAGSGKTELLTQRVLALLAEADVPEEVVAITFTRKAAAEMKDRLLQAFEHVAAGRPSPAEPHHARTIDLARRALVRDRELGWELAANPARLRVQTIDALSLWLVRQVPITTRFAVITQVTEQAEPLYSAAANATLSLIDSEEARASGLAHHIERLLTHLDNDWIRAHRLLSGMLARRDQWLRHVGHLDRAALEAPMQNACAQQMERVCAAMTGVDVQELIALARYAAGSLPNDSRLSPCAELDDLPAASHERLDAWRGLAALLLTNEGSWRAKITKTEGFPAFASAAPYKQRIIALIDSLRSNEALREALHALRALPAPRFTEPQWAVLESIVALLPRAAAELMVVFGEQGESDFVQLTHAAVDALAGGETDIAQALDARIRHLLIDEFQDTSITQFELIARLVGDWRPGDGRTLFVVGDPMQSIYRFREAEVGLFLQTWNDGLASLPLTRLRLSRNFRSSPQLVDWVNTAFVRVLAEESDIASGAVMFEPSVASQSCGNGSAAVTFNALLDASPKDEADRVVQLVQRIRSADPAASIALLARARPHLAQIVPALRKAGLRFNAVELELLLARPLIGDLLALTRVLEHLADKVAWLAVLRAPWCGLTLADLAGVAEGAANASVWQRVCDPACRAQLSADGQQRLARVAQVFERALEWRGRVPLTERVRETWWLLGGPACISTAADHADAESFFDHLVRHEERTRGLIDVDAFETSLVRLYAAPDSHADDRLQVMTIHKAKGLEFDYVIVPGVDRVTMTDDAQLMQWLERPTPVNAGVGPGELLLSPIYPADADKKNDSIYCWVERLQQQRQRNEDGRLLYVAATRARKQLHWVACVPVVDDTVSPRDNSLLQRLLPAVEDECALAMAARTVPSQTESTNPAPGSGYDQSLRRLPVGWTFPAAPPAIVWHGDSPSVQEPAIEFSWAGETARRVGVVVHRWLQRIADDALHNWDDKRVRSIAPHIERELAAAGISGNGLVAAGRRVVHALTSALSDPRARWLLGPHSDAGNELRFSMQTRSGIKRIVLDRTFVENGARWIIDYKTGTHQGADVEGFLDRERLRYGGQLELYARALGGGAQLGLYFPLLNGWRAWTSEKDNDDQDIAD